MTSCGQSCLPKSRGGMARLACPPVFPGTAGRASSAPSLPALWLELCGLAVELDVHEATFVQPARKRVDGHGHRSLIENLHRNLAELAVAQRDPAGQAAVGKHAAQAARGLDRGGKDFVG